MVPRILCYLPVYDAVTPGPYYASLMFQRHLAKRQLEGTYYTNVVVDGPRTPIRSSRNKGCQLALDHKADFLFMADNDMFMKPDLLDVLLAADKPIVGALTCKDNGEACSFLDDGNGGEIPDPEPPRTGLYERKAVGTGAMLIKCEVLAKLPAPWFNYDSSDRTMDVNFCRAARAAGFSVWVSSDAYTQQKDFTEKVTPAPW